MVQNNQNPEDIFNQLAEEQPIKDIEESLDGGFNGGGDDRPLEYYESNTPNLTDLQSLLKLLSPDFKNDIYNYFMQSRLSPEVFKPYLKLAINNEIKRCDPYKRLDVVGVSMKLYTVMTKALDGKHIIDILEAFGSKASNDELDTLSKGIGLG
jgi:hypothetical protein